jgi:hypothetical protein
MMCGSRFLTVPVAECTLLDAQDQLADSETRIATALVAGYKALGGVGNRPGNLLLEGALRAPGMNHANLWKSVGSTCLAERQRCIVHLTGRFRFRWWDIRWNPC